MKEFFDTIGNHPLATIFLGVVGLIALAIIGETIVGVVKAITGILKIGVNTPTKKKDGKQSTTNGD